MICHSFVDINGTNFYECHQESTLFYLHRYFLVGKPAANINLAVEAVLLIIFWMSTAFMRCEITKIFPIVTVLPITIQLCLMSFHTAVILAIDFPNMKLIHIFSTSEVILETIICFTFLVGSIIFVIMLVHIAWVRIVPKCFRTMSVLHIIILLSICVLTILDAFPPQFNNFDYSNLSPLIFLGILGIAAATMIVLLIAIFVTTFVEIGGCCAKKSPVDIPDDPIVTNALLRMIWSIPLMIWASLAALTDYVANLSYDPHLSTLSTCLLPPSILISLFLFIPAYRTALFCCCANNRLRRKVGPTKNELRSCVHVPITCTEHVNALTPITS